VLAAVQHCGLVLQYADATLWADKEVVLAAVQNQGSALGYADATLQADKEVVMAALQLYDEDDDVADVLYYASEELRADKEVVMAAVQHYGEALCYASKELRADREVVMAAVRQGLGSLSWDDETFEFYQSVAASGPDARSAMVDAGLPTALFKAMLEDRDLAEDGSALLRALLGDRLVVPELAATLNAIGQASPFKDEDPTVLVRVLEQAHAGGYRVAAAKAAKSLSATEERANTLGNAWPIALHHLDPQTHPAEHSLAVSVLLSKLASGRLELSPLRARGRPYPSPPFTH